MARKVSSRFGAADHLFENTHEAQEVQDVQEHLKYEVKPQKRDIGSTQGKKGQHLKRINMAFSDDNYEFITVEGRRSGAKSTTAFVNQIIDEYRANFVQNMM